jgi:hypothetical protein
MPPRKPFLLRIDPKVLRALQRWAGDDLRSLNGQIEFVLRDALRRVGRLDADSGKPTRQRVEVAGKRDRSPR